MNIKKLLCGLLAGLMLLTAVGCGNGEDTTDDTRADATAAEEKETELKDNVPALDYQDDEIVILSRYREGWTSGEISVEGLNQDPVNDAVYERNKTVEDRLHVKINSLEEHNDDPIAVINMIKNDVSGGSGVGPVKIEGVTQHKADHCLARCSIFLQIFYYLCSWYGFHRGCENAERVADRDTDSGASVVYSDGPVHNLQI